MRFRSIAAIAAFCCCAPPLLAQSLTRVQLLALQQQLRDDGCGVAHVTGRMDATTRKAVKNCMSRYNVTSGGAAALLAAMNIGFGPNDQQPSSADAAGGGMPSGMTASDSTQGGGRPMRRMHRRVRGARRRAAQGNAPGDSTAMQHTDSSKTTP